MSETKELQPTPSLTQEDRRELNLAVKKEKTSVMDPVEYNQMKILSNDLIQSRALPSTFQNAYQVQMALMAGREMGMGQMEALQDLYFVNGKLQVYGKATPSALRRAGWRIKFSDETSESCTATITNEKTGEEITDTFTFEDAELSGFTKDKNGNLKFGWKEGANRKRKLRYAVLSQIIHTYVPEVLGSVAGIGEYSEDYLQAESNDANFRKQLGEEKKMAKLSELMEEDNTEKAEEVANEKPVEVVEQETEEAKSVNPAQTSLDLDAVEAEVVEDEK